LYKFISKRGGEDMKTKSLKFVGLLSTALVAPAFFAVPATAQKLNKEAVYSRAASDNAAVRLKIEKLNSAESRRARDTLDRLLMWNENMLAANARDHTPGPFAGDQQGPTRNSRAFAIISIAVFDAVNSFDNRFRSYSPGIARAPNNASKDAAIAYAAHDTLKTLYPRQAGIFAQLLASDLANINASNASINAGRIVGQAAATAILRVRVSNGVAIDGATAGELTFGAGGGLLAGGATRNVRGDIVNGGNQAAPNWTPDPVGLPRDVALGARWGNVKTFVLTRGDQFRIPNVPAPNTARFREAFNDVATVGAAVDVTGSTSTAATQFIGNFWGYDGAPLLGTPPRLYNQVAITIANREGLKKVDDYARLLALVNTTMGDSGIAAWDSKYFHNYWRPVTGIRRANLDGDPTTVANPAWRPFGASVINAAVAEEFTPPFPAYPSGHATFGAASTGSLLAFFPNNTRFTFVSDEYDGSGVDPKGVARPLVPVRYRTIRETQVENGRSRVFNGVHWEYDDTEGQRLGENIARFTIANAFQRR
jgi:membrane-associated phospholipid phosphatase